MVELVLIRSKESTSNTISILWLYKTINQIRIMRLHQLFLMIIALVLVSNLLGAQEIEKRRYNFGLGAGVSLNNVFNHNRGATFDTRFSPILITAVSTIPLKNERLGLMIELDYIHKGPSDHDINYLILSGLLDYQLLENIKLKAVLGPYLGYLFKYKLGDVEFKADKIREDFGLDAGLFYAVQLSERIQLFLSPRVEVGLIRFSNSNHISSQLKIGVLF